MKTMDKFNAILLKICAFLTIALTTRVFAQEEVSSNTITEGVKNLQDVAQEQIDTARHLLDLIIEFAVKYSFQAIGGIIVLVIGWLAAKYATGFLSNFLEKKKVDITVSKFIVGGVKLTIMAFVVIVALGKFGIEIAPLIAGISVAGFGLSFALQGPLSNYAAGAALIFTKPFKVGDIIEVAGVNGEVTDLKLPRTELKTVDGEMVVVPNKHIIGEIIHNFSDNKRLDITVGVSYSADIAKAIKIVKDVIAGDSRMTKQANVGVSEFADSSVNIYARTWCKQDEYWNVLFDTNKNIFDAFKKEGVEIPFPQRDIHIIEDKTKK